MIKILFSLFCFFSPFALFADACICLTMLVTSNTEELQNSLNSIEDIVDCACIFDLGASEEDLSTINQFFCQRNIPIQFFHHDWVDYGHNRTLSIESSKQALRQWGISLENSYLLLLDPGMQLITFPEFQKENLWQDSYMLWEESIPLYYGRYHSHLLRADFHWKSIGAANEYWTCPEAKDPALLHSLKIVETISSSKLKATTTLLTDSLILEPDNPRYLFYLALNHQGLGNFPEAASLFERYLDLDVPKEETWFSKYMIGHCYEQIGEWDKALFWYLEAYQSDPSRAESLQKIATYYRYKGFNDLAYLFSGHGSRLPFPEEVFLSPLPPLFPYQFDEEVSISAYYTQFKSEGHKAINHLILRKNVPWTVKDQAYRNLLFYIHPLPDAHYLPIEINFPLIRKDSDERYHPMNPSIRATENGYQVICRTVNYTQKEAKFFDTTDPSGIFRTRNFLIEYDTDFNVLSHAEIIEDLPRKKTRAFNLEGLDDCRIFAFQDQNWFTCNTSDTSPLGRIQISLCRLSKQPSGNKLYVDKLVPLLGPDLERTEKNWLPFIKEKSLHVIYSYDPLIIFQVDPDFGRCEISHEWNPPLDFSRFRGSAGPIAWENGYLIVVHEVVFFSDYSRIYIHRFLRLDESFTATHLSDPFIFKNQGIEFCSGGVINQTGDQLILTLGIEDREAYFCFLSLENLRSLLHPLPNP